MLDVQVVNSIDYYYSVCRATGKSADRNPVDVQATINSSNWDAHGVVRVLNSNPISFTANFPLRIGTEWNAFQLSPLNVSVDFASSFMANAPQLFHPAIFEDGVLSRSVLLS